jgi:hypothetical protein
MKRVDETGGHAGYHLFQRAAGRILLGSPPQKLCAVPEAVLREVIVPNLTNQAGTKRLPFHVAFTGPPAGATGLSDLER